MSDQMTPGGDLLTREQVLDLLRELGRPIAGATLDRVYRTKPPVGWSQPAQYVDGAPLWRRVDVEVYAHRAYEQLSHEAEALLGVLDRLRESRAAAGSQERKAAVLDEMRVVWREASGLGVPFTVLWRRSGVARQTVSDALKTESKTERARLIRERRS